MSNEHTGTMAGEPERPADAAADPGLVLVFAPDLEAVPSVVLVANGSTVLGREPPPGGVVLPLTSVSRTHARLTRKGQACSVHDLGSRNGVFVRGQKVESADLEPGDDLRIGDAVFVFVPDHASLFRGTRADGEGDAPYPHAPVACGPITRRVYAELEKVATSDLPVLVHGETGSGKELVAQAVHAASGRGGPLRAINCAAIPAQLVESELFGFKKGAFTGADRDSTGVVRSAHGGTLFLDEIGDLPTEIQPKLLRLLESFEVTPVGAVRPERVDVRIVCATHADLNELVAQKRFRGDLLARIRGHVVALPPLRARKEDLYRLVRVLLARLERTETRVSVGFMVALARYDWPYNVRELYTVLRRATALAEPGEVLDTKHLPEELLSAPPRDRARDAARSPKAPAKKDEPDGPKPPVPGPDELRAALQENGGNVAALARIFQRDRSLIHRWLKLHGIEPEDYRGG